MRKLLRNSYLPLFVGIFTILGLAAGLFANSGTFDKSHSHLGVSSAAVAHVELERDPSRPVLREKAIGPIQIIHTSQFSSPSPDPVGIIYIDHANTLLLSDSEVDEWPMFSYRNMFNLSLDGEVLELLDTIKFSAEPNGITYNPDNQHLFITDDSARAVWEVDPGSDKLFDTIDDKVTSFDTRLFGSKDPEGLTYNSKENLLHIVDGKQSKLYTINPGENGKFEGFNLSSDDKISSFNLSHLGIVDPEGIAWDSANNLLYIVSSNKEVAHVTLDGKLVRVLDVSSANAWKISGLAYAPSSKNKGSMSLYMTDKGRNEKYPDFNDGKLFEFVVPALGKLVAHRLE